MKNEIAKDIVEDLVRPTSKSIGNNIGLAVDGVMGWIGYWGKKQAIKREEYLEKYKQKIAENIYKIPENQLKEPSTRILGPAIEASKFFIEEEEFREIFAKLISSECDVNMSKFVHPSFVDIIKQLSSLDARLLKMFGYCSTFPCVEIYEKHCDGAITPCKYLLLDFKEYNNIFSPEEEIQLTKSVDNLSRLGLMIKNKNVIELNYEYNLFKDHWIYKSMEEKINIDSTIKLRKYRIELTEFGKDFAKCCFQ